MRISFLPLLLGLSLASYAQRTLEIVSPPTYAPHTAATMKGHCYFIDNTHNHALSRYDGINITDFSFPSRDGVPLVLARGATNRAPLLSYKDDIYIKLRKNASPFTNYLYRFNGISFTEIRLPGDLVSNHVVYQDQLHMMVSIDDHYELVTYNGITVRTVSGSSSPNNIPVHVVTGNRHLYIQSLTSATPDLYLKRYNGVNIIDLPVTDATNQRISTAIESGTGEQVFFRFSHGKIQFYNGSILTDIPVGPYRSLTLVNQLWHDEIIYTVQTDDPDIILLYASNGTTTREIAMPAGEALINLYPLSTYHEDLILALRNSDGDQLVRYNGTTFSHLRTIPDGLNLPTIEPRGDKLLVTTKPANGGLAYEYDGTNWVTIEVTGDQVLYHALPDMACYHVWSVLLLNTTIVGVGYQWVLAVEREDPDCIPPPAPAPPGGGIIPGNLHHYDRLETLAFAPERDWCWTGIDINWRINPLCPNPPCEVSPIRAQLTNARGKVAWEQAFQKPGSAAIPLTDNHPYHLTINLEENKSLTPIVLLDGGLVEKGLAKAALTFYPASQVISLSMETDKDISLPFNLAVKDIKGKTLWRKTFTAPLSEKIQSDNKATGAYLHLTPAANIQTVTYYPNPAEDVLYVNNSNTYAVTVILTTLNGVVVYKTGVSAKKKEALDLSKVPSGMYVITIIDGGSTQKELLPIK